MRELDTVDTVSRCIFCDRRLLSDNFVMFERRDGRFEAWCTDCYEEHMVPMLASDRPDQEQV